MEPLADERVAPDEDTNPLVAYDAERERVKEHIDEFGQSYGEEDEQAVPTELLQEDIAMELDLPVSFSAGRGSSFIAGRPWRVICVTVAAAVVSLTLVLVFARNTLSVDEELFLARGDPDVKHFYELRGNIEDARSQLRAGYVKPRERHGRRLRGSEAGASAKSGSISALEDDGISSSTTASTTASAVRRRASTASTAGDRITLVYERRGLGASNVLALRQLKAIHDFETDLFQWSVDQGTCFRAEGGSVASHGCRPMDSLHNYLYPYVNRSTSTLTFDGRMVVEDDSECAYPPFNETDVAQTVAWLKAKQSDGNLQEIEAALDQASYAADQEGPNATNATAMAAMAAAAANTTDEGGASSQYLRSTLYIDALTMTGGHWYDLATKLYHFSNHPIYKNWYVRLYFGGSGSLVTAELLVLLTYDLFLLLIALTAIGLYMRLYFGQWRLASLACLQILLSFPLMYFFVLIPFGQHPLSAFAAASLWVVIGVSADNIFVLHETWGQSRMLRRRGQRCTDAERVAWTVRQASIPLFFANATTAGSLFVNCFSPIVSILQFGLCGGVLIFANFLLVLTFFPAVLVLEERGSLRIAHSPPDLVQREQATQAKMHKLQSLHRSVWENRAKLLAAYGLFVLVLFPYALQTSPGADTSFTFAPDPNMEAVIARARLPISDESHIFRSSEPIASHAASLPALHGSAASSPVVRYNQLLAGTFEPPHATSAQGPVFAALLTVLGLYDSGLLLLLGNVLTTDVPRFFLQPPQRELAAGWVAQVNALATLCLVSAIALGGLSWKLCDFSHEARVPVGEVLWVWFFGHSGFFCKLAMISNSGESWGMIRASNWMNENRSYASMAYTVASVVCLVGGIVVLVLVNGSITATRWSFPLGWVPWGPAGTALWIALLWLYNGFIFSLAARAAATGESVSYLRSLPRRLVLFSTLSTVHYAAGWLTLLLAGTPIARDLPAAINNILALWLALNSAAHASVCRVIYRNRPSTFFTPTDFSERSRGAALLVQVVATAFFAIAALVAWFIASNPTPCDYNTDDSLGLGEITRCLLEVRHLLHLPPLPPLPSLTSVFIGLCLATLWILDAVIARAAIRALTSPNARQPFPFFAPVEGHSRIQTARLLRRLRSSSVTLFCGGGSTALLAFIPPAFKIAFGPHAIIASNLIAITLLIHVPFFLALSAVFRTNRSIHMLHPTEWSHTSKTPSLLAALAALSCFVTALVIFITQDTLPGLWVDWPPLYGNGIDFHGLLLFLTLCADAAVTLTIADVQYANEPWRCFRPLPGLSELELLDVGANVASAGGMLQFVAFLALIVTISRPLGSALFGDVRILPMVLELSFALHGLALFLLGYLFRRSLAVGVFEPPPPNERHWFDPSTLGGLLASVAAHPLPKVLHISSAVSVGLALTLPLTDGWLWWEALGVAFFLLTVGGALLTHGLYTGDVIAQALGQQRRVLRRASFAFTSLMAALMGAAFALAIANDGHLVIHYYAFFPVQYMLVMALCVFALVNFIPIAAIMEVWYAGLTVCGFSREDAPHEAARVPSATVLLIGALACAVVGGALCTVAFVIIQLNDGTLSAAQVAELLSSERQTAYDDAENCDIYWGVQGKSEAGVAELISGFNIAAKATQLELAAVCTLLHTASAPFHPDLLNKEPVPCFMKLLREHVVAHDQPFPIEEASFYSTVVAYLREHPEHQQLVGMWDGGAKRSDEPEHVAWLRVRDVRAQFATRGASAVALLSNPPLLLHYKAQWDVWFSSLPGAVRAVNASVSSEPYWAAQLSPGVSPASVLMPPPSESALKQGVHVCAKWNVLATLMAFFQSVTTALTATPFFTLGAIALFSRSLIISYAAFYCLVAMVLTLLGLMHMLDIPLGPVPALALALVVGMSVDYIIHIAHAYNNSIFDDRFYKSRAAVFARAVSVTSAAITTLGAVAPLLGAQLLPLREFGQIFVLVTVIAITFSLAFLAVLMIVGPRRTRGLRRLAAEEDAEESRLNAEQRVTEPHSEGAGWAVQVTCGDSTGPRPAEARASAMQGMAPRDTPEASNTMVEISEEML